MTTMKRDGSRPRHHTGAGRQSQRPGSFNPATQQDPYLPDLNSSEGRWRGDALTAFPRITSQGSVVPRIGAGSVSDLGTVHPIADPPVLTRLRIKLGLCSCRCPSTSPSSHHLPGRTIAPTRRWFAALKPWQQGTLVIPGRGPRGATAR